MKHQTTQKLVTLLLISFFLLASSCNKETDEQELPPITTTGENTFGCLIDGHVLIPRDGTGTYLGPDRGVVYAVFGDYPNHIYDELRIVNYKSSSGGSLKLHFDGLHNYGEGTFTINESNCQDGLSANESINISCSWGNNWYCSIENGGTVTISKYDIDTYIFSGTFNCTVQNRDNPDDIIEISEGRFDFNLQTLQNTLFP